jgi:hypothetical protein
LNPRSFTIHGLNENWCRNPNNRANGIWCWTNEVATTWELCSVLTNIDYVYEPVKNGPETLLSTTKPVDDFTNTNPNGCPIVFSIVKSDGSSLDPGFNNWIYINSNNFVEINEFTYTGGDHSL